MTVPEVFLKLGTRNTSMFTTMSSEHNQLALSITGTRFVGKML